MKKNMRIKKGFTLIELLAVIVVLAIIALIATPMILNLIGKTDKEAFRQSSESIIYAGKMFQASQYFNSNNDCVYFNFDQSATYELNGTTYSYYENGGTLTLEDGTVKKYYPISDLSVKGSLPTEGELEICPDTVNYSAKNNLYCAKYVDEKVAVYNVASGVCEGEAPSIELKLNDISSNSCTVLSTVTPSSAIVEGAAYKYYLDGVYKNISNTNTATFNSLNSNTTYSIKAEYIVDGVKHTSKTIECKTTNMPNPKIEYQDYVFGTWTQSQITNIYYNSSDAYSYYFKVTKSSSAKAVSNIKDISGNPISSGTTLEANTKYYPIDSSEKVVINLVDNTTVLAVIDEVGSDGTITNTNSKTVTCNHIDLTAPIASDLEVVSRTTSKIKVRGICTDSESGISELKFSKNGTDWVSTTSSTYEFRNLNQEDYSISVKCVNGTLPNGIEGTAYTRIIGTCDFINPSFETISTSDPSYKTVKLTFSENPECSAQPTFEYRILSGDVYLNGNKLATGVTFNTTAGTLDLVFRSTGSVAARSVDDTNVQSWFTRNVTIDATAPSCTYTADLTNSTENNVVATLECTELPDGDFSGFATSEFSKNVSFPTASTTKKTYIDYSSNVLTESIIIDDINFSGDNKYYARVKDNNGNTTTAILNTVSVCEPQFTPTGWSQNKTVVMQCSSGIPATATKQFRISSTATVNGTAVTSATGWIEYTGQNIVMTSNGAITTRVVDSQDPGNYMTITRNTSTIDTSSPTCTLGSTLTSNSKSITKAISAVDNESGLASIDYKLNDNFTSETGVVNIFTSNDNSVNSKNINQVVSGLSTGTSTLYLRCTDAVGRISYNHEDISTCSIATPTLTVSPSGYATSKTVTIGFTNNSCSSSTHQFKIATGSVTSNVALKNGNTTVAAGTTLSTQVWYKIASGTSAVLTFTTSGSVTAQTYDSDTTENKTSNVSVDTTAPSCTAGIPSRTTTSLTAEVESIDTDSGTESIGYKISTTELSTVSNYDKTNTFTPNHSTASTVTDSYKKEGLTEGTNYYTYVTCTNGAGLSTTVDVEGGTCGVSAPSITLTGTNSTNPEWLPPKTITIGYPSTPTGCATYVYYFKYIGTTGTVTANGTIQNTNGNAIAAGTALSSNTWYKALTTAPILTITKTATITAVVFDSTETFDLAQVESSSYKAMKTSKFSIDDTAPICSLSVDKNGQTAVLSATATDDSNGTGSGIAKVEFMNSETNTYTTIYTNTASTKLQNVTTSNHTYTLSSVTADNATYTARCTNGAGLTKVVQSGCSITCTPTDYSINKTCTVTCPSTYSTTNYQLSYKIIPDTTTINYAAPSVTANTWINSSTMTASFTINSKTQIVARVTEKATSNLVESVSKSISKIDRAIPTVSANSTPTTIVKGTSIGVQSLFAFNNNWPTTTGSTITKSCTVGGTSIANTSSLAAGSNTITCNICKGTICSSASKTLTVLNTACDYNAMGTNVNGYICSTTVDSCAYCPTGESLTQFVKSGITYYYCS